MEACTEVRLRWARDTLKMDGIWCMEPQLQMIEAVPKGVFGAVGSSA